MELRGKQKTSERLGRSGGQQQQTEGWHDCTHGAWDTQKPCLPSSMVCSPIPICGQPAPHHYSMYRQSTAMPTYLRVQVADQKDGIPGACQPWNGNAAGCSSSSSSRGYGQGCQGSMDIRNREACKGRQYSCEPGWLHQEGPGLTHIATRCCLAMACPRGHTHCLTPRPVQV